MKECIKTQSSDEYCCCEALKENRIPEERKEILLQKLECVENQHKEILQDLKELS